MFSKCYIINHEKNSLILQQPIWLQNLRSIFHWNTKLTKVIKVVCHFYRTFYVKIRRARVNFSIVDLSDTGFTELSICLLGRELITDAFSRVDRDDVRYRLSAAAVVYTRLGERTDIDCTFRIARNAAIIQSLEWHTPLHEQRLAVCDAYRRPPRPSANPSGSQRRDSQNAASQRA